MRSAPISALPLTLAALLALAAPSPAAEAGGKPATSEKGAKVTKSISVDPVRLEWFGQAFFLLTSPGGTRIAIDPFGKGIGYPLPEDITADAVCVTHDHFDHNNVSLVKGPGGKKPRVFLGTAKDLKDWSEVKRTVVGDVTLRGVKLSHDTGEKKIGKETAFVFETGGLRIVHLGDLGRPLGAEQIQEIGEVDVLLIPVGGTYTIDAAGADKVVAALKPRVIIPMHYKTPALTIPLAPVDPFLQGKDDVQKVGGPTATLEKAKLPAKPRVVVLTPAGK